MAENEKIRTRVHRPRQAGGQKKALETALAQIEKNFGKGAIMRLGTTFP